MDPNAENYINDQSIEMAWLSKTIKQAEVHYSLIQACKDCSKMRLTNRDDEIFALFQSMFPNLKLEVLSDDDIKNEDVKPLWREFCNEFQDLADFNFATLLRLDCRKSYSEENTTIVPRVQFLAIEIARNRNNLNNNL